MHELVSGLVTELDGAARAHIRERARLVLFPDGRVDRSSLPPLLDAGPAALGIVTEIARLAVTDQLPVDETVVDDVRSWAGRMRGIAAGPPDVVALYWLDRILDNDWWNELEPFSASRPAFTGEVTGIAAAIAAARGGGRADDVFREFLASPTLPRGELYEELGDARPVVRRVLAPTAEGVDLLAAACDVPDAIARFQNIGLCAGLDDDAVARHLWDPSAPVRLAAVNAIRRAGPRFDAELARLRADPTAGLEGDAPARVIEMLRSAAEGRP